MAFNFGGSSGGGLFQTASSTSNSGGMTFGATQPVAAAAPAAGTAFGFGTAAPASSAAAPAFGGFGTAPAANTSAPSFGFGGGTAPAFGGGGFGGAATQTTSAAPASFGFGAAPASSAAVAPTFGGFGAAAATTAAPTFGGGAFGTSTSAPPVFGGFGGGGGAATTTTTAAQSFGAFGTSTSTAPMFGSGSTSFSFNAPQQPTFGGFGAAPQTSTSSLFGAPAAAPTFAGFGNPQQQQQQQAAPAAASNQVEAVLTSVLYCNLYGDERDAISARWNVLQAAWGTGKGYYSSTAAPVQYDSGNSLCRFKSIGYTKLTSGKNEDGIVLLMFNKPEADVRRDQPQLVNVVSVALGSKSNLNVVVDRVSALDENRTEVLLHVQERSATGAVHKAPAIELSSFLWQPNSGARQQLTCMGVTSCVPKMRPSLEQLREYLSTPPAGIDVRLWKQAQAENPVPDQFIPIPLVGFGDLVRHLHLQEKETSRHGASLDGLAKEITELKTRVSETSQVLKEQKRKVIGIQHRVLKILISQECSRKKGFALQPDEERLGMQLESIHNELSIPTHFRGRLNELLSQIRMRHSMFTAEEKMVERYNIEPSVLDDFKHILKAQQDGMAHLLNILKEDFQDLNILQNALKH